VTSIKFAMTKRLSSYAQSKASTGHKTEKARKTRVHQGPSGRAEKPNPVGGESEGAFLRGGTSWRGLFLDRSRGADVTSSRRFWCWKGRLGELTGGMSRGSWGKTAQSRKQRETRVGESSKQSPQS